MTKHGGLHRGRGLVYGLGVVSITLLGGLAAAHAALQKKPFPPGIWLKLRQVLDQDDCRKDRSN